MSKTVIEERRVCGELRRCGNVPLIVVGLPAGGGLAFIHEHKETVKCASRRLPH